MYSCFFLDSTNLSYRLWMILCMVAMFVLKKSSETLPLCPKRRDHSIMKNVMMLQHIMRIHHQRNYWLLYLLTIYCWYNQLFHHKLDSVSYYASPETSCYHVVDCVYSLIVVFTGNPSFAEGFWVCRGLDLGHSAKALFAEGQPQEPSAKIGPRQRNGPR